MVEETIVLSSATLMDAEQKMDVRILHAFSSFLLVFDPVALTIVLRS